MDAYSKIAARKKIRSQRAMSVNTAQDVLGVTFASVQNNVMRLVKLGILREVTGRKRDGIFIAPEILQLTGAPEWANDLSVWMRTVK